MARRSVEGFDILDKNGRVLYDGDIVRVCWGGGNDGKKYRLYAYHRLSITKRGRLRISGCDNIVEPKEISKQIISSRYQFADEGEIELDKRLKEYYD